MLIFITGGAGYVGRPVVHALTSRGHAVIALIRTSEQRTAMQAAGAASVRGDLGVPESYAAVARTADAIVHLAAPKGADGKLVAQRSLETLLEAARTGNARHFIYTSVLFVLGDIPAGADETTPAASAGCATDRAALEGQVLEAATPALSTAVIRPGMVYGGGEGGSVSELFRSAVDEGAAQYVGDGRNRWSLIHRSDVASLFALVLESGASGVFHATDGAPLPVEDVARRVANVARASGGTRSIALEEAQKFLGPFATALSLDQPVTSPRSHALGWRPAWKPFTESAAAALEEFQAETGNVVRA